ncbi:MAG: polysaccharide biosynthesis protein [Fusobacteriaceae bacterium]
MTHNPIIELFSNKRNIIKFILDSMAIYFATVFSFMIIFEWWKIQFDYKYFFMYYFIFFIFYLSYKIGTKSWTYTNSFDVVKLGMVNLYAVVGSLIINYFSPIKYSKRAIVGIFILSTLIQLLARLVFRMKRHFNSFNHSNKNRKRKKIIVYGAGEAGVRLLGEQYSNTDFPYQIIGFMDDDPKKKGTYINDVKVFGMYNELQNFLSVYDDVEELVIAIPNFDKNKLAEIVKIAENQFNIQVKILPTLDKILEKEDLSHQVRDISIEDLLGREQILVNGRNISEHLYGKIIFVTGGGGSIGSELIRQIAKYNPKKIIGIDLNENDLYFLELELKGKYRNLRFFSEITSVRDTEKLEYLFSKYNPQIVFHAAAHKHVPLMENNPEEAIKNNIFGTRNMIELSDKYEVERFVLISTDKAVNPTNVMGATKRACELLLDDINEKSKTKYMAVRFGNVLGSNGSVIPYFRKLLAEGKNLTVTHEKVTRYFMTIEEAAQLVIEAGSLGNGGEIFILDMGKPVLILDLAKSMIELSGTKVGIDIVGLREGEKLYEELLYDIDSAEKTSNQKIFITKIDEGKVNIKTYLNKLEKAIKNPDKENIKEILKEFIHSYKEPEHHKK